MGSEGTLGRMGGEFKAARSKVQRRGCDILVTIEVDAPVSTRANRRIFGGSGSDRLRVGGHTTKWIEL